MSRTLIYKGTNKGLDTEIKEGSRILLKLMCFQVEELFPNTLESLCSIFLSEIQRKPSL